MEVCEQLNKTSKVSLSTQSIETRDNNYERNQFKIYGTTKSKRINEPYVIALNKLVACGLNHILRFTNLTLVLKVLRIEMYKMPWQSNCNGQSTNKQSNDYLKMSLQNVRYPTHIHMMAKA
jgi:hypothetical protein